VKSSIALARRPMKTQDTRRRSWSVVFATDLAFGPMISQLSRRSGIEIVKKRDMYCRISSFVRGRRSESLVLNCRSRRSKNHFKSKRIVRSQRSELVHPKGWIFLIVIFLLEMPTIIRGQTTSTGTDNTTDSPMFPTFSPPPTFAPSFIDGITTQAPGQTVSQMPTQAPTRTPFPSGVLPSFPPTTSFVPTGSPSVYPTEQPTFKIPSVQDARFRQKFLVGNGRTFNDNEISIFETLYQSYTKNFAPIPDSAGTDLKISTECIVEQQEGLVEGRFLRNKVRRRLQTEFIQAVNMDYEMRYESAYYNVSSYPILFQNWINQNLVTVTEQMRLLQLNVTEAQTASRLIVRTPAPTISPEPSQAPSGMPTITPRPSGMPSFSPSDLPTTPPVGQRGDDNAVVVITVSLLIGISIVGIGLLIYCRKRRYRREHGFQEDALKKKQEADGSNKGGWNGNASGQEGNFEGAESPPDDNNGSAFRKYADAPLGHGVVPKSESLVSNQSLLSAGNSMAGDSGDEADTTQIFADEFDQYKDQNLEKMRAEIEGNLEGCDGMMSQAVARALIDEDDLNFGNADYLWGGTENVTGAEIEASALGDVMDWLKRHETASVEEKRSFMQDTLNKMVASVRHGVLGPDDASRTIHECAALLGLQLAADIPVTTVVISGMRKKATAEDIVDTFSEFGSVSTAAVAPNERGFGILRFKNNDSVDRAMKRFRKEEVVVQDVGVQLKVIKSGFIEDDEINGAQ